MQGLGKLSGDDREKYKPVKEKITKSEGKKKIYCMTLFSEAGHALFREEEKK